MRIRPQHVAALFYATLALFLSASWVLMSNHGGDPSKISLDFVRSTFSAENENREWFVWFAIATIVAPVLTGFFLWERASSRSVAPILALVAALYLGLSLWQFDSAITFSAGGGFVCALFGCWRAA